MKNKPLFEFKPFSTKQRKLLNWWTEESPVKHSDGIIAEGSIRSGKTIAMAISYGMWAMENFDGKLFALCGKTITSLRMNVVNDFKKMMRSRGYYIKEVRNLITVKKGKIENTFEMFGGKDKQSFALIQGRTLAGALFDEVALQDEEFVKQALARCSVENRKFWFNCNPDSPFHWFKRDWIDKRKEKGILHLHFELDDNLSLSEKIKNYYKSMFEGVFYKRYILGLWVAAEGLIFSNFSKEKHCIKRAEVPICSRYYISIDFGIQNPMVFSLFGVIGDKKYLIEEYHHSGAETNDQKTVAEYADALQEFREQNGFNITEYIIDPSAKALIVELKKRGIYPRDAKNAVIEGISNMSSQLTQGLLFICDHCKETLKEFAAYMWDVTARERGEEKPVKKYDHHMDTIRYFIHTIYPVQGKATITNKPMGW